MATIKSFTDIPQSKMLLELLSPESADMFYSHKTVFYNIMERRLFIDEDDDWHLHQRSEISMMDTGNEMPCWSLAALLGVLPKVINNETLFIETSAALWHIGYRKFYTAIADNPVDACVAMIEKLHELNFL